MNTQHYFLTPAHRTEPQRWREAFPQGYAMCAVPLLKTLRTASPQPRLVWLSAGDGLWPDHLAELLKAQNHECVVLLSDAPNDDEGLHALNAGARGYAHAYAIPELLQEVALVVQHGGLWIGSSLMQRLIGATQKALGPRDDADTVWARLSEREARVAKAVTHGHSNKEVADMLHISERTVKAHLTSVFEKLGVRDRLQLVLSLSTANVPTPKV